MLTEYCKMLNHKCEILFSKDLTELFNLDNRSFDHVDWNDKRRA